MQLVVIANHLLVKLLKHGGNEGKCPLTPSETAFILQSLSIPMNANIYLADGDGLMELEGLTSISTNVYTKSSLLSNEDFVSMHGNTKAAMDYYVSINSHAYVATYFGNMDKMVAAMRALKGLHRTLFLSQRAFAEFTSRDLKGNELVESRWEVHRDDFVMKCVNKRWELKQIKRQQRPFLVQPERKAEQMTTLSPGSTPRNSGDIPSPVVKTSEADA